MSRELRTRATQLVQDDQPCTASINLRIPPDVNITRCISHSDTASLTHPVQLLVPTNTTTCPLLNLPLETLIQILTHLVLPDAISLALACKSLLSFAHVCRLQVPRPQNHRQPWALTSTPAASLNCPPEQYCHCGQLSSILPRIRPRDVQSRPSRAWTLCVDCASYRPTRKSYWSRKLGRLNTQDWGKDRGDVWQSAVRWFAAGVKVQCPTCRVGEDDLDEATESMEDKSLIF
ncbi:F-box domain, cyclin-like protein [Metarhizium rileyi]|uniref:F-box domain, cyclin-like protein n=1 Tax=Metarhizium rileyi (strain RCEF 4871) TaxID=1649241 RepID=A0A166ZF44_METRR|nr:F-box domain, cyclin-like protein [Metarhizium rileyi RCEF 4871]